MAKNKADKPTPNKKQIGLLKGGSHTLTKAQKALKFENDKANKKDEQKIKDEKTDIAKRRAKKLSKVVAENKKTDNAAKKAAKNKK